MKVQTSRKAGFTFMEIMIVVAAVGLLCAIAVPSFIKARTKSQATRCINNLRQIDAAIQQWAADNNKGVTSPVTQDEVQPYLGHGDQGQWPTCPGGGSYILTTVEENATCSLGVTVVPNHVLN